MADKKKDEGKKAGGGGGVGMSTSQAKNWEQRLRTEMEAPHKWTEAWGELFNNGVPTEYTARVEFLKEELKKHKKSEIKYTDGSAFPTYGAPSFRKQKFGYYDPLAEDDGVV